MKPRITLIGTGGISEFHVPALEAAGFDIVSCCGSPNSIRAKKFGFRHNIEKIYSNYNDAINDHKNWDCILIASSVDTTFPILKDALKTNKPIMVEKPVSMNPNDLLDLKGNLKNVVVAYNRRFYSTVQYAKEFINENNPCQIKLELPDSIDFNISRDKQKFFSVRENSVHGFDLLFYLLPELKLKNVVEYQQPNNSFGKYALLNSPKGDTALIYLNWNSPSNFSLNIECNPYRLELKPFESFVLYHGMEVVEASEEYPVRRYVPKVIDSGNVFINKSKDFKPGFLEQALEFKNIILGGKKLIFANIDDAFRASDLADKILNT